MRDIYTCTLQAVHNFINTVKTNQIQSNKNNAGENGIHVPNYYKNPQVLDPEIEVDTGTSWSYYSKTLQNAYSKVVNG